MEFFFDSFFPRMNFDSANLIFSKPIGESFR
jgi:hypothetical protein